MHPTGENFDHLCVKRNFFRFPTNRGWYTGERIGGTHPSPSPIGLGGWGSDKLKSMKNRKIGLPFPVQLEKEEYDTVYVDTDFKLPQDAARGMPLDLLDSFVECKS